MARRSAASPTWRRSTDQVLLLTQTLVLLVIRTLGNPLRSRPSGALLATTLAISGATIVLPFVPFAARLGFVPLPLAYFGFLLFAVVAYLFLVEMVKRPMVRARLLGER